MAARDPSRESPEWEFEYCHDCQCHHHHRRTEPEAATWSKEPLKDPRRIALHRSFRRNAGPSTRNKNTGAYIKVDLSSTIDPSKKKLKDMSCAQNPGFTGFKKVIPPGLHPILLSDMDPNESIAYQNRLLRLTLMEDPIPGYVRDTPLVAQDEAGNTAKVILHRFPYNGKLEELSCGTQLGIVHPFHLAEDEWSVINVVDLDLVIHLGRKLKVCRYCGKEGSQMKCAKCEVAYCSRPCQLADWNILKHKLICKK